ncbi:MAG: type 2 isopentenyl-diphosphate Delta-isomerase [Chloroflexota bacterium]
MTVTRRAPSQIGRRKDDHLRAAAEDASLHHDPAGLRAWRLRHRALPGRDLADVSLTTSLLGRELGAPLLVSCMTGGTDTARMVNDRLAAVAAEHGLAMGLGSGRALLADPDLLPTYRTPDRPPLLLANLGAVQLRLGMGSDQAERLVDLLDADALALHLNPVQEAVQPEGDPWFRGLAEAIAEVVERLAPRPVVVKEVGFGLAPADVAELLDAGVAAVDVAGAGGTNWALVEGQRDERARAIAHAFRDWGWPTAEALQEAVVLARPRGVPVIASGGITDGVEAAIALALGATAAGMARPFLLAALDDRVADLAETVLAQLRIAVWATGVARAADLRAEHLDRR